MCSTVGRNSPIRGRPTPVRSDSHRELVERREAGSLSAAQADTFLAPRSSEELFDCRKDGFQLANLIGNEAFDGVHQELKKVLAEWMRRTGDDIPRSLTRDWFSRSTGLRLDRERVRGEMPGTATGAVEINATGVD